VADEPSFEWSRDLLVGAPGLDREIPVGGRPLPPAQQRDLGVDEASKVCDLEAQLRAADSVQGRARPSWIEGRRTAGTRPAGRTRVVGTHRPSGATARRQTRLPTGGAKRFAEIRRGGASHTAPARGGRCSGNHPHMPPFGRSERAFGSALMPGRPARGPRSQAPTGPTLLRSQPNTRLRATGFGYVESERSGPLMSCAVPRWATGGRLEWRGTGRRWRRSGGRPLHRRREPGRVSRRTSAGSPRS
jgi:hypothetical protein